MGAFSLTPAPLPKKIHPQAIPGQVLLYAQVAFGVVCDLAPSYALAFVLYLCLAPLSQAVSVGVNSFVWLFTIYMVYRTLSLIRYQWIIARRWNDAPPPPFHEHAANFRDPASASRHIWWSYLIGNVGVAVRCAPQVVILGMLEWTRRRLGLGFVTDYAALAEYVVPIYVGAFIVWLATIGYTIRRLLLVYYRAHRTFHACKPLYDCIHGLHHKGVLPTPLDSGTIAPAEFAITEYAAPTFVLVPGWYYTIGYLLVTIIGHWPGHHAGSKKPLAVHHLHHHRHFNVNFGLTPFEDARFGTLHMDSPSDARPENPAAEPATAT